MVYVKDLAEWGIAYLFFVRKFTTRCGVLGFSRSVFMKTLLEKPNTPHLVVNLRTKKRYAIPHSAKSFTYTIDELIPEKQRIIGCYTIGEIWALIVRNAWATGEPGLCF